MDSRLRRVRPLHQTEVLGGGNDEARGSDAFLVTPADAVVHASNRNRIPACVVEHHAHDANMLRGLLAG
jgi:hypothetical protein